MATWKRYFTTPNPQFANTLKTSSSSNDGSNPFHEKMTSGLKEVYTGPRNRFERYNQYDQLDRDPVINSSLNIIAEFCTQENNFTKLPFVINYTDETNEIETQILKDTLDKWAYVNSFRERMFYIWRNTIKYGDVFFIRDPETYELMYVDPRNVKQLNVLNGKVTDYEITNVDVNLAQKIFTNSKDVINSAYTGNNVTPINAYANSNALKNGPTLTIPEKHVVHLSMNSTGLDQVNWPFGASILESVYKPAKQKELLEDAYLIYKIQRAPERRVFYIYTGDQPAHKAMAFVERVKNDFHQKRIPSRQDNGFSMIDSSYAAAALTHDFFLPVNAEGQGPRIETLPGGGDLSSGDGDLLDYFNNSVITGLGIPLSYLPTATRDAQHPYSDGKVGVALLQEWRFAQMCERIQSLLRGTFDFEFKLFCKKRGISIMASEFNLELEAPQSFSEYRQMEKDQTMFSILSQAESVPYLSKRFVLKRFGYFTEDEIIENERLWKEENKGKIAGTVSDIELNDLPDISLNNVGVKKSIGDDEEEIENEAS